MEQWSESECDNSNVQAVSSVQTLEKKMTFKDKFTNRFNPFD